MRSDDGDLRNGGFGEGEEQLRAVLDDAAVLLRRCRARKPGTSTSVTERDVEAVAEADEARGLHRRVDVEDAGEDLRLVGDDADRAAADAGEADDDVRRVLLGDLEEVRVVDHGADDVLHVVGPVRLESGSSVSSSGTSRAPGGSVVARLNGGSSWLFAGRYDRSSRTCAMHVLVVGAR